VTLGKSEIRFRPRFRPGPRLGSLRRSPDHLVNSGALYTIYAVVFPLTNV